MSQCSRLNELGEVSVRELLVSSAGSPGEIAATTPSMYHVAVSMHVLLEYVCLCITFGGIVKLDLSQNHLLSDWQTVSDITSQLSLLTTLKLRFVYMHPYILVLPKYESYVCVYSDF